MLKQLIDLITLYKTTKWLDRLHNIEYSVTKKTMQQLTYYIKLCQVSICDQKARVACGLLRTLQVPIVTCSHTMTEETISTKVQVKS